MLMQPQNQGALPAAEPKMSLGAKYPPVRWRSRLTVGGIPDSDWRPLGNTLEIATMALAFGISAACTFVAIATWIFTLLHG